MASSCCRHIQLNRAAALFCSTGEGCHCCQEGTPAHNSCLHCHSVVSPQLQDSGTTLLPAQQLLTEVMYLKAIIVLALFFVTIKM